MVQQSVKDGKNTQTKEKAISRLSQALFRPSFLAASHLEEPFSSLHFLRSCTDLAGTKHGGCWCRCRCCATGICLLVALSSAGQELGAQGHVPARGTLLPSASSPSRLSASACVLRSFGTPGLLCLARSRTKNSKCVLQWPFQSSALKGQQRVPTRCCGTQQKTAKSFFLLLPHPPGNTALILTFGGRGRGGSLSTQPWQPALPRCLLGVVVAFSDTAVLAVAGDNQGTAGALGFSCSEPAQRLLSVPT